MIFFLSLAEGVLEEGGGRKGAFGLNNYKE